MTTNDLTYNHAKNASAGQPVLGGLELWASEDRSMELGVAFDAGSEPIRRDPCKTERDD